MRPCHTYPVERREETQAPSGDGGEDVTGRRIAAAFIDFVPLLVLFYLVAAIGLGDVESSDGSFQVRLNGAGTLVWTVLWLGYHYVLETTTGRSLGKAALGLRVVGEDGQPPTPKAIALRTVLRVVDVLPIGYIVGFVTMLAARPRGRRVGDLVAHTSVVRG